MTDRRRIEEWAVLYELEPTLRDVFVEGPSDRAFISTVLAHCGLDSVKVYEIDAVDVPSELLGRHGLRDGNRSRVIATAMELERTCTLVLTNRVCCVADADCEAGRTPEIRASLLLYTDYASMDLYAYSSTTLERYFQQVVLGMPFNADKVLEILEPVLREAALTLGAFAFADTSTYDTHGRLIGVTYSNGSTVTYTYDAAGNRTAVSQTP